MTFIDLYQWLNGSGVGISSFVRFGVWIDTIHNSVAIQIVGGQALSDDHPLAETYRRVRATRLAEGMSDVLRINVARGDLDLGLGRI